MVAFVYLKPVWLPLAISWPQAAPG